MYMQVPAFYPPQRPLQQSPVHCRVCMYVNVCMYVCIGFVCMYVCMYVKMARKARGNAAECAQIMPRIEIPRN